MRHAIALGLSAALLLAQVPVAEAQDANAAAEDMDIPAVTYPELLKTGASIVSFIPQGWTLEQRVDGDLNADGLSDAVLVLRDRDPANVVTNLTSDEKPYDTNPRMLAVAFAEKGGGFTLGLANHTLILRNSNPGQEDPLVEGSITVERGSLVVELGLFMSTGGWDASHSTFRFRRTKQDFRLIGFDRTNVNRGSGKLDQLSINYLTGKVIIGSGSIESDVMKERTRSIPKAKLLTMDEVGDGLMFDPGY